MGGRQKQKLIESLVEANKSLAKEIKVNSRFKSGIPIFNWRGRCNKFVATIPLQRLEDHQKTNKTAISKRERIIKEKEAANEALRAEVEKLHEAIEKQKVQLNTW